MFQKTKNLNTLFLSKTGSGSNRFAFYRSVCLSNQNSLIATFNRLNVIGLSKRRNEEWVIRFTEKFKKYSNIVAPVRKLLDK